MEEILKIITEANNGVVYDVPKDWRARHILNKLEEAGYKIVKTHDSEPVPEMTFEEWCKFLEKIAKETGYVSPTKEQYRFSAQMEMRNIPISPSTANLIDIDIKKRGKAFLLLDFQKQTAQCIQAEAAESIKLTHSAPRFEIQTILQPDWAKWLAYYPALIPPLRKDFIEEPKVKELVKRHGLGEIPKDPDRLIQRCVKCREEMDDCTCWTDKY